MVATIMIHLIVLSNTDIDNGLMDMVEGETKERVGCMETVTWKYILPYVK